MIRVLDGVPYVQACLSCNYAPANTTLTIEPSSSSQFLGEGTTPARVDIPLCLRCRKQLKEKL
jgi:hypothetical protein